MTVCYFGNYDLQYSRNRVIIKGLRQNGVEVLECQTRARGIRKFWNLWKIHKNIHDRYDVMIVGFSGFSVMWFARLLTGKPIIFDAFVSLYLSDVEDRKLYKKSTYQANRLARLDKLACLKADLVLLDTRAQIDYFVEQYKIPRKKFVHIPVGVDDSVLHPVSSISTKTRPFVIHWLGNILPFYALEVVAQAASILKNENIEFRLIAPHNRAFKNFKNYVDDLKLTNMVFHDRIPYQDISKYVSQADIALGVFGDSLKAKLVIPNKVIEAAACAKLSITARQHVISEIFVDGKSVITVNPQDPKDLAEKIIWLKNNPEIIKKISEAAYNTVKEKLTSEKLGNLLLGQIKQLINEK